MEQFEETYDDLLEEAKETKSKLKKYKENIVTFLKNKKNLAIVILSVLLLSNMVYIMQLKNKKVKEVIEKEPITKGFKLKEGVFLAKLNEYEVTKVKETTSLKSGKDIFGVWYQKETPQDKVRNSVYLVIYENIDNLNLNKKAYEDYVKKQVKQLTK